MQQSNCVLRRALPSEAEALTALEIRSKASWGYDAPFMERLIPDLQISESDLRESETVVAERDGVIAGFTRLKISGRDAFMTDLFIEPQFLRTGVGRQLFEKAVEVARQSGAATLALHSDPNAEAFYERMGMRTVSHVKSTAAPNRFLPVMIVNIQ